jgi:hypothetical protein
MPGRHSSLVVRILLVPLIVLAPLGALLVVFGLFPSAPDWIGGLLMLLFFFWGIVTIMLVPAWLFGASPSSSGPSDDGGDGGDMDPPQPPGPRGAPRGDIPLPDADQARERLRDHGRPDRRGIPPRRHAPEPEHVPVRTLPAE